MHSLQQSHRKTYSFGVNSSQKKVSKEACTAEVYDPPPSKKPSKTNKQTTKQKKKHNIKQSQTNKQINKNRYVLNEDISWSEQTQTKAVIRKTK